MGDASDPHTTQGPSQSEGSAGAAAVGQVAREAFAAYRAGEFARAEALCAQILARQPENYDATFLSGVLAARAGRGDAAVARFRKAIALRPGSAEAHLHLGGQLRSSGRHAEAAAAFEATIRLDPSEAAAHNDLGLIHLAGHRWPDAAAGFERAIALKPDFAIAHYNLGLALQAQNRDPDAMEAFRRAAALAPRLAEAHGKLGNLLYAYGYHKEALASFRRAAEARPGTALGHLSMAKVFLHERRLAEAEECLRRALALDPRSADGQRLLGMVLQQAGRFEEAIACLEQAIARDGRLVAAYYDLVYAKKLTEADRTLVRQMEALLEQPGLPDQDRTRLCFALGKAHDDLGDHAAAIRHYDVGNRIERARYAFDRARHVARIDRAVAVCGPDFFARFRPHGSSSEAPLFILGMMRSGTTLVEQIVSSHPEVGAGGELTFWGDAASALEPAGEASLEPAALGKPTKDYLALLHRIAPGARRVTDKTPHNFLWLGLIHAAFPRARIIHCRRNPVDTCLSIYFTYFGVAKDFAYDRGDIAFFYEQYARLMAHWRAVLPADRFLELDYEALIADREAVTRRLIAFCGLEWNDASLSPERNQRAVTTASIWQARQPVYRSSVERWRHYEPWLGELRRLSPSGEA
jgi:tetratricopeptide (TPR) repeat protein